MAQRNIPASSACAHLDPEWSQNPEIVRWVKRLAACYCVICLDWVRERDRLKFVQHVRAALAEGKCESEVAKDLGLDETADPFAPPERRTYFQILLRKSGYSIQGHSLRRLNPLSDK